MNERPIKGYVYVACAVCATVHHVQAGSVVAREWACAECRDDAPPVHWLALRSQLPRQERAEVGEAGPMFETKGHPHD